MFSGWNQQIRRLQGHSKRLRSPLLLRASHDSHLYILAPQILWCSRTKRCGCSRWTYTSWIMGHRMIQKTRSSRRELQRPLRSLSLQPCSAPG